MEPLKITSDCWSSLLLESFVEIALKDTHQRIPFSNLLFGGPQVEFFEVPSK